VRAADCHPTSDLTTAGTIGYILLLRDGFSLRRLHLPYDTSLIGDPVLRLSLASTALAVNIAATSSVASLITPQSLEQHPTDRATAYNGDVFAAQQVEQFGQRLEALCALDYARGEDR
jgi:hypothetical protein